MRQMTHAVEPPAHSVIAELYDRADLVDAFAITMTEAIEPDIDQVARAVLGNPSWWFRALLACRDVLVAPFGVKTSATLRMEMKATAVPHIDFFPIVRRSAKEVIIGSDDKHLDFRTSVLLRGNASSGKYEVVVTTVAHSHNRVGQIYLRAIAPFHRRVARSSLQRAAAKGW